MRGDLNRRTRVVGGGGRGGEVGSWCREKVKKAFLPFLTRGYARAYFELLQGQRYANESLAHS